MEISVSSHFPLSESEINRIYDDVMSMDVTGIVPSEFIDDANCKPICRLITDSWFAYCDHIGKYGMYPSSKTLGRCGAILGSGPIWIAPRLDHSICIKVFVHELSHLLCNSYLLITSDGSPEVAPGTDLEHGPVFENVFRRACKAAGIHEPVKGSDMSKFSSCFPFRVI